jgi:hypothetical protein
VSEEKSEKSNDKKVAHIDLSTIPLFFLIVVLFESILLLIVSLNFYYAIPSLSSLFSGLVGVIVGGLLTFFTSYYLLSLKHLQDLKSIARGFISELQKYKDNIQSFFNDYPKEGLTTINLNLLQEMNRPIFDNDSLYYALRKEMFQFDEKNVEKLLHFYSYLMIAEEDRRRLLNLREDFMKNTMRIIELQTHMFDTLQQATSLIPDLIKDLTFIIDRKI